MNLEPTDSQLEVFVDWLTYKGYTVNKTTVSQYQGKVHYRIDLDQNLRTCHRLGRWEQRYGVIHGNADRVDLIISELPYNKAQPQA